MESLFFGNIAKLGYAPKIISSSHWIFEYELGATSDLEIEEIDTRTKVKLNLYDIYGRLYDETIDIDATTSGPQKVLIDFEGMFLKQLFARNRCIMPVIHSRYTVFKVLNLLLRSHLLFVIETPRL